MCYTNGLHKLKVYTTSKQNKNEVNEIHVIIEFAYMNIIGESRYILCVDENIKCSLTLCLKCTEIGRLNY